MGEGGEDGITEGQEVRVGSEWGLENWFWFGEYFRCTKEGLVRMGWVRGRGSEGKGQESG